MPQRNLSRLWRINQMSNFGPPPGVTGALPVQSHSPAPAPQDTPQQDTRVVVGPCVLSYPKLFTPQHKMGDKTQPLVYSAEFLVYQSNPQMQAIYQKLYTVASAVAMSVFRLPLEKLSRSPLRSLADREGSKEPGFFVTASTGADKPPKILVGNPAQPCVDPEAFYAGAIVFASLTAAPYDKGGNRGVKFYLNSVLKAADGERLAPARSGAEDFADVLHMIPQTPAAFAPPVQQSFAAPPQYAPPAQPGYAAPPMQQYVQPPQQYAAPPQGYAMPPMPGYPQQ